MIDTAEDRAREMVEDRAVDMCPADELPGWPLAIAPWNIVRERSSGLTPPAGGRSLTALRDHLELFAEAVTTPREDSDGRS